MESYRGQCTARRPGAVVSLALFLSAWLGLISALQTPAFSQEKRRYLPDDWISYTDMSYVRSIAYDSRYVYFGTSGGVGRYNRFDSRWEHPYTESDGLPGHNVFRVGIDRQDSNLWAVLEPEEGDRYNRVALKYSDVFQEWREERFSESLIESQEVDFRNDLRYSFLYPNYLMDDYLRQYEFNVAVETDRGDLWVGTEGGGVIRYYLPTLRPELMKRGPIGRDVSALLIDGDSLWMGGRDGLTPNRAGISRFDRGSNEWEYFEVPFVPGLHSAEVARIIADSSRIYLGTRLGLSIFDPATGYFRTLAEESGLVDAAVLSLAASPGRVWIGTHFGLYVLDEDSSRIHRADLPQSGRQAIRDLYADNDTVYAATDFGAYWTVDNGGRWDSFPDPLGSLAFGVSRITSGGGIVWLAYSGGVMSFQAGTGEFERYPGFQFGFSNRITALAADRVNLWMGTDYGLVKLDRATGIWYSYTRTQDRLLDDLVQCLALEGDYLWIGSPMGLTRFFWNDPYRNY